MGFLTLLALTLVVVLGVTGLEDLDKKLNVESEYLGCYKDDKVPYNQLDRDLTFPVKDFFGPKVYCVNACAQLYFRYAGLQNGYLCFCGNSYGKYGRLDDKFCNMECRGSHIHADHLNRTSHGEFWKDCGGRWANAVYSSYGILKQEHLAQEAKADDAWLYTTNSD